MAYFADYQKILGFGEFGCVYRAVLKVRNEEESVAMKTLKDGGSKLAIKSLLSEIKILCYLGKHVNVVSMKGAYTAEFHTGVLYVATELCSLGSLQKYLRQMERENIETENLNKTAEYSNISSERYVLKTW